MKDATALKIMIYTVLIFVLSAICAGFIGKMIITDTVYYVVSPSKDDVGILSVFKFLKEASFGTLLQLLVIFLAGFSFFSFASITVVNIIRGGVFGFTIAMYLSGIAVGKGIVHVAILFSLTSIVVVMFSGVSVCFFKYIRKNGVTFLSAVRYTSVFFICSGCAVLLDGARLLFI